MRFVRQGEVHFLLPFILMNFTFARICMQSLSIIFSDHTSEAEMSKNSDQEFDASIGLAFSLKAFELYRKSGTFSAEVRSVPGIRGHCQAYLELVQGKVIACYFVDRKGERHSSRTEVLLRLDEERGPFNWSFRANTEQMSPALSPEAELHTSPRPALPSPVFRPLVPYLDGQQLQWWTPQQQQYLSTIFSMIDGQRTLDAIKARIMLPPNIVDEGIQVLLQLKVIAL